jgi:hypothetical protein
MQDLERDLELSADELSGAASRHAASPIAPRSAQTPR